jgi:hypothetical protein
MTLRELMECWLTERPIRYLKAGIETTGIIYGLEHQPGDRFHLEMLVPGSYEHSGWVAFATLGRSDRSPLDAEILDRSIYPLPEMTR